MIFLAASQKLMKQQYQQKEEYAQNFNKPQILESKKSQISLRYEELLSQRPLKQNSKSQKRRVINRSSADLNQFFIFNQNNFEIPKISTERTTQQKNSFSSSIDFWLQQTKTNDNQNPKKSPRLNQKLQQNPSEFSLHFNQSKIRKTRPSTNYSQLPLDIMRQINQSVDTSSLHRNGYNQNLQFQPSLQEQQFYIDTQSIQPINLQIDEMLNDQFLHQTFDNDSIQNIKEGLNGNNNTSDYYNLVNTQQQKELNIKNINDKILREAKQQLILIQQERPKSANYERKKYQKTAQNGLQRIQTVNFVQNDSIIKSYKDQANLDQTTEQIQMEGAIQLSHIKDDEYNYHENDITVSIKLNQDLIPINSPKQAILQIQEYKQRDNKEIISHKNSSKVSQILDQDIREGNVTDQQQFSQEKELNKPKSVQDAQEEVSEVIKEDIINNGSQQNKFQSNSVINDLSVNKSIIKEEIFNYNSRMVDRSIQYSEQGDKVSRKPSEKSFYLKSEKEQSKLSQSQLGNLSMQMTMNKQHSQQIPQIYQESDQLIKLDDLLKLRKQSLLQDLDQTQEDRENQLIQFAQVQSKQKRQSIILQAPTVDHVSNLSRYSPNKKYSNLTKRLEKIRDLVEDLKYKDYLKKVEILNQKKAYLSTYRFILKKEEKQILIKEIEDREAAIEQEEKEMFLKQDYNQ